MEFDLQNAIEFSKDGDLDKTMSLDMRAPTAKDRKQYFQFQGMVARAMMSMAEYARGEATKESSEEPTSSEISMMLKVGLAENFDVLVERFVSLAKRVVFVDESMTLKDAHIDQMAPDEIVEMMARYTAFFIMPSLRSGTTSS